MRKLADMPHIQGGSLPCCMCIMYSICLTETSSRLLPSTLVMHGHRAYRKDFCAKWPAALPRVCGSMAQVEQALIRCSPHNILRVALADSRCHLRKAEAGRACLSYAKPARPARSSDTRDWPCQANNASFSHGQVLYAFYMDRSYRQPSASSECRRVHMASAR